MLKPKILLALIAWFVIGGLSSAQQRPPRRPRQLIIPEKAAFKSLASQFTWARLEILNGKVTALSRQAGRTMFKQMEDTAQGRREQLTISGNAGLAGVRYELTSKIEHISVEINDGSEVVIRRQPQGEAAEPAVEFRQLSGQPLSLSVTSAAGTRVYEAPTFWHLILAHPHECRKHLVPLLELLRPAWRLVDRAAALENALFRLAKEQKVLDRGRWAALVEELGSDRFSARQRAERQLRAAGRDAVPYLRSLDLSALDAEQRFRIRSVLPGAVGGEDTPDSVSLQLVSDPSVWFSLLSQDAQDERRTAAAQLALLLGEKVDFDPAADDAARRRQLEALRPRIRNE